MERMAFLCPMCEGRAFQLNQETQVIPYFGEVLLTSEYCSDCGYRHSDVFAIEDRPPKRFTFSLRNAEGLDRRVIRSGTSFVKVEELGVTIDPGVASSGYVTNVEGLILRIKDIVEQVERDLSSADDEEKLEKAREVLKKIDRAIEGRSGLTIVIEDPRGNSAIIGDDVIEEELTPDEIATLRSKI